jgi:hypothetical protein
LFKLLEKLSSYHHPFDFVLVKPFVAFDSDLSSFVANGEEESINYLCFPFVKIFYFILALFFLSHEHDFLLQGFRHLL